MTTIAQLSDRVEIAELQSRYALAMDRADGELFRSVWADDAELHCDALNLHRIGITEIMDYFDRGPGSTPPLPAEGSALRLAGNSTVQLMEESAVGVAEFVAYRLVDGKPEPYTFGYYDDRFQRTQDGWRFASRIMTVSPVTRK